MHILMAAGVPNRREGGVAAIIYNYGRELQNRGHDVAYLFYDDLLPKGYEADRFRDSRFAFLLAQHVRQNRANYSVVNLHAPTGFLYGLSRQWMPARSLPPYVMTLHGLEERRIHVMSREEKKGRAWHFSFVNRMWQRFYHAPRYFMSIKTASFSHCYSRDVWTILQLKYNLDSDRVAYIPNGVEERFFLDRKYERRETLRLLYAGTWLDQRGVFYIRDALNSLNQKFRNWTFTIAGSGFPARQLHDFFGDALRKQISIESIIPAGGMPGLYARHDVLLFPSLMEGLPSVLLEAMAGGMAVITAETCGMPDVVEDGFNGLLVPPADASAIENAILRLHENENLCEKFGKAAQDTMRRYTWQRSAEKLENVFASAIQRAAENT
jgi:glycosyltransferase involved in cell wall biosynthesis